MSRVSETERFTIGAAVSCTDGDCGDLKWVVVDPVARTLTHLVVEARHRQGIGHLVPIDLVESDANGIRLHCTRSEFEALKDAEETRFLRGASGQWDYEPEHIISLPYFSISTGSILGFGVGNAPSRSLRIESRLVKWRFAAAITFTQQTGRLGTFGALSSIGQTTK